MSDVSLKELIKEGQSASEVKVVEQSKAPKKKNIPHIEIVLENDSDFVLRRKTSATSRMLVVVLSQGMMYLKDEKNGEITQITKASQIIKFLEGTDYRDCSFSELKYKVWDFGFVSPHLSNYMSYALKHRDRIQQLVNRKIFLFSGDRNFLDFIDTCLQIDERFYDNLSYANGLLSQFQVKMPRDSVSTASNLMNFYSAIKGLEKLGITKDKINNNLENLLQAETLFYDNIKKYSVEDFLTCIEYGNLEFNRLSSYLAYLRVVEGLTGGSYNQGSFNFKGYYDYLNMQKTMFGKIKEKYPINWLTEKHKLNLTYSAWEHLHKEEVMLSISNKISNLSYSDDKYSIVIPKTTSEVVDEGYHLGHCVASYVDSILKGQTNIVFLRRTNQLNESLVTVEVKNNTITQFRGAGDRHCNKEELDFLIKWGKEKNLDIQHIQRRLENA
ncbi:MAG: PcfJ domain-containing protein [Clostridia bacterium]|nr:PcfJ domain-containing protein [Clostridia bacterium]